MRWSAKQEVFQVQAGIHGTNPQNRRPCRWIDGAGGPDFLRICNLGIYSSVAGRNRLRGCNRNGKEIAGLARTYIRIGSEESRLTGVGAFVFSGKIRDDRDQFVRLKRFGHMHLKSGRENRVAIDRSGVRR